MNNEQWFAVYGLLFIINNKYMGKKEEEQAITEADLKFKNFELAKKLGQTVLETMIKEGVTSRADIGYTLSDLCKFIVMAEADVNREGALHIVKRMTEINADMTCLMMRIVAGQTMEDLK